jgi:hypothetical protein
MSKHVTETEINNFLESKLNLQIATIDEEGYPMIQLTWFLYERFCQDISMHGKSSKEGSIL